MSYLSDTQFNLPNIFFEGNKNNDLNSILEEQQNPNSLSYSTTKSKKGI